MSKYDITMNKEMANHEISIYIWADDALEDWYGSLDIQEINTDGGRKTFTLKITEPFKDEDQGGKILIRFVEEAPLILALARNFL